MPKPKYIFLGRPTVASVKAVHTGVLPPPPRGFKHVPGFPGYAASRAGAIASCREHRGRDAITAQWRQLWAMRPVAKRYRYLQVYVRTRTGAARGGCRRLAVHLLVLLAYRGHCPKGQQACHKNDNPLDPRLKNLRYGTPRENATDRVRNTRMRWRAGTYVIRRTSKLTVAAVRAIRRSKESLRTLARRYGVGFSTVRAVRLRRAWKHVL